ncbi:ATP-binding cassette domain-containing protein [Actinocorallia longicatena]|uniref:ABC transporter domain-containing protein n=1 Tax=Actinocorallia longicatena TaxID=111803 RepID=A0ABP6QJ42_9ACTN
MIEIVGVRGTVPGRGTRGLVSLTVRPGEIVALCGHDATTLLDLVTGDTRPAEGTVRVNGLDPYTDRSRVTVAALSADDALYGDLTLNEIAGAWRTWATRPLPAAANTAMTGLTPRGTVPYTRLTPSERRRFDLAMALTTTPDALVITEPTTSLPTADSRAFWRTLRTLPLPILIATTSPREARKADRALLLTPTPTTARAA